MSEHIYDLVIVGAGPAGITAAVYAARKGIDFILISLDVGGQAAWSGDIENYTGYQFITGPELTQKFQEHMKAFEIPVNSFERVKKIIKEGALIKTISEKTQYLSRSLIIATGKRPKPLNIEGEDVFKNKGVSYCATCDGPLFKDKTVAIIGGGNSALDAALQLMKICVKVYIINILASLTGDAVMIEKVLKASNVEVLNSSQPKRVYGDKFVEGLEIIQNNSIKNLNLKGVFVEIGLIPNAEFTDIVSKNAQGEVIIDCNNNTNIEGIFAAGDVTNIVEKQIIIACGEGSKALLSAFKYLSTHKF